MTDGRISALCATAVLPLLAGTEGVAAPPTGGVFIPRNGGYEGRIGAVHIFIDGTAGGSIEVVQGEWPQLERRARLEMAFVIQKAGVTGPVRQAYDHSPEIIFIEEGNERLGVRVKCRLYDESNRYHGHAMTETWMYPTGELFITAAAMFEDRPTPLTLSEARVALDLAEDYETVTLGASGPSLELASSAPPQAFPFTDEALPQRHLVFPGTTGPDLGLYWRTGKMEYHDFITRPEGGSPTYYRWPVFLLQAYQGGSPLRSLRVRDHGVDLSWLEESGAPASDLRTMSGLFRILMPGPSSAVEPRVEAERQLLDLDVKGGEVYANQQGYNDLEGVYVVRKMGNPVEVIFPPDPRKRVVRVKVIGLEGCGGVGARLDGAPVVPHLASEGGIADDPLAPIRELPEGPADMALIAVPLGDQPRRLTVQEQDGVQFVYQTRDAWRNVRCFSTRGGGRYSLFNFSLIDGRARNTRGYGQREWALTENLLTWFLNCGYTPEQMIDQLVDFRIVKNGPDEAVFRYLSQNANGDAESEYVVRVPADSPAMQMNVAARFTVRRQWPYPACQFFDVFPFRGVDPQDWWYEHVLWVAPDGRVKWMNTIPRTYEGDTELSEITGDGFFALYSSERGNMLLLAKNFDPPLPTHYVICANYVDFHMDVHFNDANGLPGPPPQGFTQRVEYDLAIWGDENTSREELIAIGRKSLQAGALVLPER